MGELPTGPGWYDDHEGVASEAYWDGETWTGAKRGKLPTKPGWYDDPDGVADQAYWDGETWTGATRLRPLGFWLFQRSWAGKVGVGLVAFGAWTLIAIPANYDFTYVFQWLAGSALLVIGLILVTAASWIYARNAYVVDSDWSVRVVAGVVLAPAASAVALWWIANL